MNREEAIRLLDLNREYLKNANNIGLKADIEALEMAIKALSQEPICDLDCEHCTWTECPIEPCDDAISRQAVINAIENECMKGGLGSCFACYNDAQAFRGEIEKLPSVNPQKSGKWIRDTITDLYHCSECRLMCHQDSKCKDNYCKYCGAKMESEVRNDKRRCVK